MGIEGKYLKNNNDGIKGMDDSMISINEDDEEEELSESFKNLRDNHMGYQFECQHWAPDEFIPHTGLGVTAIYRDRESQNETKVLIGSLKYMNKNKIKANKFAKSIKDEQDDDDYDISISMDDDEKYQDKYLLIVKQKANQLEMNGNTCIFIAINGQLCCILAIADKIKSDAYHVIDYLQNNENIPCYMITGDNQITANAIGKLIGIPADNIRANVSPGDKQNIVKQLQ